MEYWQLWVLGAIVLFGVEMFTTDMVVGSIGVGCLCSALVSRLGAPMVWQLVAFSVGTLVLMAGIRPRVKEWLYRSADTRKSGVQAMIGRTATVVDGISATAAGRVRIGAEEWRAVADDGPHPEGREVLVVAVEAATLQVRAQDETKED
jgi:membrane protein implicated in regulation of membrane protease activity